MYKNVVMSVTKAMRYRDVPKVFGHCDFLLYISCKTTNNLSLCLNHEHLKSVLPKII